MEQNTKQLIAELAAKYETAAFLPADPSSFMHSVQGDANREATAFSHRALATVRASSFPQDTVHHRLGAWRCRPLGALGRMAQ